MKELFISIFLLFSFNGFLFSQSIDEHTSWSLRGPRNSSSYFNGLVFDKRDATNKTVLLSTWTGMWKCEDFGQAEPHWNLIAKGIGHQSVVQSTTNLNLFYASGNAGIYKSMDGGDSWSLVTLDIIHNGDFISSPTGQVYYYRSFGADKKVHQLNLDTGQLNTVFDLHLNANQDSNFFITDVDIDKDGRIYVSIENGKIFKSSMPGGGAWSNIMPYFNTLNSGDTQLAITKDPLDNIVLASFNVNNNNSSWGNHISWIKKSINGGTSWTDLQVEDGNGIAFNTLGKYNDIQFVGGESNIALSSNSRIFWTSDSGTNWTSINDVYGVKIKSSPADDLIFISSTFFKFLSTPFTTNATATQDKQGDIHSLEINTFTFNESYDNNKFVINNKIVSGDSILSQETEAWQSGRFISDTDEPDINLNILGSVYNFPGTIKVLDRNLQSYKAHVLDSLLENVSYDHINNSLYHILPSTNNKSIIRRIKNLDTNQLTENRFVIDRPLSNNVEIVPATDSTLYIFGYSLGNELLKVTLKSDFSTVINSSFPFDYTPTSLIANRENPQILILEFSYGLYMSIDGGTTWSSKKTVNRVNDFSVNPGNMNQVFVASTSHIYFTENFTTSSPTWTYFTDPNIDGYLYIPKVWYRESDGTLFINPPHAGLFSSKPHSLLIANELIFSKYATKISPGEPFKVTFYQNGPFSSNNSYELWLSDETGDFTNSVKIGTSDTSPIYGCIPVNTTAGNSFKLRLISTNGSVPIIHKDSQEISTIIRSTHLSKAFNIGNNQVGNVAHITSVENLTESVKSNYKAWNSVILKPEFEAIPSSGGTFKAEIVGCDN